jgi:hypothetical protein
VAQRPIDLSRSLSQSGFVDLKSKVKVYGGNEMNFFGIEKSSREAFKK